MKLDGVSFVASGGIPRRQIFGESHEELRGYSLTFDFRARQRTLERGIALQKMELDPKRNRPGWIPRPLAPSVFKCHSNESDEDERVGVRETPNFSDFRKLFLDLISSGKTSCRVISSGFDSDVESLNKSSPLSPLGEKKIGSSFSSSLSPSRP